MKHTHLIPSLLLAIGITPTARAQQDTTDLEHIVVTATRAVEKSSQVSATVTSVDRQTLLKHHEQNVLPTLTYHVPGLFTTSRSLMGYGVSSGAAGGISIRGMQSGNGQVMVLIDGKPQYQGIFGHSISDAYQTIMAERVEVVRGPASVLYGSNAMGGVVNIVTRSIKEDGMKTHINLGAGSYGTIQGDANYQVKHGRFSSTVAAQYGRSDNHRPHMGFEQYGGYVKLAYDINSHWQAYADLDMTHFSASNPGTTSKPKLEADQWITRGMASIGVTNNYRRATGRINVYDNFGRHKVNDGYVSTPLSPGTPQTDLFRSRDALAGVSMSEVLYLLPGNTITAGIDYQHIYGRAYYTSRATGQLVTTPQRLKQSCHVHNNEVAAYVDIKQSIGPRVTLDAGLRYDHHNITGGEWIPQGAIIIRPMQGATIKANVGKGYRNPTTKELFLYGSANQALQPERMTNYELAWQHSLMQGRLSYGVNAFLMKGDNLIQTIASQNVNTGYFKNAGVEADLTWRINAHWLLSTNHSYIHMQEPLLATPQYKGYVGADMAYGKWKASMGMQFVEGLYTKLPSGSTPGNTDGWCMLNVTLSYRILPQMRLWVKGDNLLAQRYAPIDGMPMPKATFMAGVSINL